MLLYRFSFSVASSSSSSSSMVVVIVIIVIVIVRYHHTRVTALYSWIPTFLCNNVMLA